MTTQADDSGEIVVITDRGYAKRVLVGEIEPMSRYRKGVKILEFGAQNGSKLVYASYVREPYDIAVIKDDGALSVINTEDIKIENRTAKGKRLFKEKTAVVSAKRIK
jgi:topoisomerase-4 subunit A